MHFRYKRWLLAMIFNQFMVRYCGEMLLFVKFRFAVLVVLLVLPLLSSSNSIRKRRRPNLEHQEKSNDVQFPDQIAQATKFKPHNINAAPYSTNKEPGNARRGNLIVNLGKHDQDYEPNLQFKSDLADTQTAEEYVQKALEIQGNGHQPPLQQAERVPETKTRYSEYEVYENEPTQTEAPYAVYEKDSVTLSNNDHYNYQNDPISKSSGNIYKEYSKEIYEQLNRPKLFSPRKPIYRHQQTDNLQAEDSDAQKEEILRHIEESVNKYMKSLEAEGKFPRGVQNNKQYYNHEERPSVHKPNKKPPPAHSVHDIIDNLNDNIQFIYKTKTRPPLPQKHYLHFDHSTAHKNHQEFDAPHILVEERPFKTKLSFNSDAYRDNIELPYRAASSSLKASHQLPTSEPLPDKDFKNDGYPIMNPYQFVLQKQPSETSWHPFNPSNPSKFTSSGNIAGPSDSYNPKFNNNPEGYGYQHNYKPSEMNGSYSSRLRTKQSSKRGKRGGTKSGRRGHQDKDEEASVALRPPPYQTNE